MFSRDGSLRPSSYMLTRALLMTSSHSEGLADRWGVAGIHCRASRPLRVREAAAGAQGRPKPAKDGRWVRAVDDRCEEGPRRDCESAAGAQSRPSCAVLLLVETVLHSSCYPVGTVLHSSG